MHTPSILPGETLCVFRRFTSGPADGQLIALFPAEDERDGLCLSYMHTGGNDTADYEEVIGITVPAKAKEYKELKEKLESIGYHLAIRQHFKRRLL